jgi:PIN like domain
VNRFNVFVDNDLPAVLAKVLGALLSTEKPESRVVALRDVLPQNTPDIDWIEWIRQQDGEWIVLTGEVRIRTVPAERDALRRARLRVLHMPKSLRSKAHHERCATLIWQWPRIVRTMTSFDPPVMFEMSPRLGGRLKTLDL